MELPSGRTPDDERGPPCPPELQRPTLAEAVPIWARIAALSFGGPAGQIAVMHRILVEERRWLGDARFLHALNFCMILPGPEAQQLATYIGWLMHGVRGALVAGILFILPGVAAIMALSWLYAAFGDVAVVSAMFFGLKSAVLAIIIQALLRIGRRTLGNPAMRLIALAAFLALFLFDAPFPVVIALAALTGWAGAAAGLSGFHHNRAAADPESTRIPDSATVLGGEDGPSPALVRDTRRAAVVALVAWLLPVAALWWLLPDSVFTQIATFFAKLAVLTFGGAYAVLAWVAQQAVDSYGWLAPGEMLDGLGMAETTPGPLIMVLQFVGFMAAFRDAGWDNALLAGTAGGLLATWVTFAPCFAWIFLGAPYMETLRRDPRLASALSAVTAAVVGVILNLAVWFAMHVIWRQTVSLTPGPLRMELPLPATLDPVAAMLSVLALAAIFALRLGMGATLSLAAAAGVGLHAAGLL
ncbi:chromate efflux transporter [Paracoccus salsus]|uniref:chromate efflux transporter n=1 Tax=Paracoccus salsus TaxID=2911061 RepID=UPI001F19D7CC|nr:chromate efflux transporter [Paracoccus salsus]MCF3973887.1 chromate efflux transporter [Paracoccus salsus]